MELVEIRIKDSFVLAIVKDFTLQVNSGNILARIVHRDGTSKLLSPIKTVETGGLRTSRHLHIIICVLGYTPHLFELRVIAA